MFSSSPNAVYVGANLDGRLEVFAMSADDTTLHHIWQTEPNDGWSDWGIFPKAGGGTFSAPAGVLNFDGGLEVFLVSQRTSKGGGNLFHIWQTEPNDGWSGWDNLWRPDPPQLIGYPVVVKNASGRLEVFVMGDDGNLYHIFQAPSWTSWESLGNAAGVAGTPAAVLDSRGQLRVFTIGTDSNLYYRVQTANDQWLEWVSLGNPGVPLELNPGKSQLVQLNANGQLEAFAVGNDGNFYHIRETTPGGWSAWKNLGNPPTVIGFRTTGRNADGRLVVFIVGDPNVGGGDGRLWYTWQTTPNGEFEAGWAPLGSPGIVEWALVSTPAVGTNADGRLEIFAVAQSLDRINGVFHIWQTDFLGGWSSWDPL